MTFQQTLVTHFHNVRPRILKRLTFRVVTTEAAEDILQEAYYRALKYQKTYNPLQPFDNWFSRIVASCTIDYQRQERGYVDDDEDAEEVGYDCPAYPARVLKEILDLIQTKSEIQIEVLNLFYEHGYSAKDISELTGYPYARCHKIISRFREELNHLYQ